MLGLGHLVARCRIARSALVDLPCAPRSTVRAPDCWRCAGPSFAGPAGPARRDALLASLGVAASGGSATGGSTVGLGSSAMLTSGSGKAGYRLRAPAGCALRADAAAPAAEGRQFITTAASVTSAPASASRSRAAATVPPVASTSSTIATRRPVSAIPTDGISRVAEPYSRV